MRFLSDCIDEIFLTLLLKYFLTGLMKYVLAGDKLVTCESGLLLMLCVRSVSHFTVANSPWFLLITDRSIVERVSHVVDQCHAMVSESLIRV